MQPSLRVAVLAWPPHAQQSHLSNFINMLPLILFARRRPMAVQVEAAQAVMPALCPRRPWRRCTMQLGCRGGELQPPFGIGVANFQQRLCAGSGL